MATTVWEATDNYAFGTLKFGINTSSTQITFNTGEGNNFNATLENRVVIFGQAYDNPSDDSNREIVRITQNAGDVFDITDGAPAGRGLEGTAAGTWAINDKVALVLTNAKVGEIQDAINDLEDGTNPVGNATSVGGRTPTVTPTADSIPISQAAAAPLALGWMNFQYAIFTEEQTSGTNPGYNSAVGGRTQRRVNTQKVNTITGSTFTAGTYTLNLPAGTYYTSVLATVDRNCAYNKIHVYNSTATADILNGNNVGSAAYQAILDASVEGYFTLGVASNIVLQHYTQLAGGATTAFGTNVAEGGVTENYLRWHVIRVA